MDVRQRYVRHIYTIYYITIYYTYINPLSIYTIYYTLYYTYYIYTYTHTHTTPNALGVTDFEMMKDLPLDLRSKLKTFFNVGVLTLVSEQISKDGTRKRAYRLQDGQLIESVLMPYNDGRRTACISSQAGCAMGCVFCATGTKPISFTVF
jgi:hypothetical protein